MPRYSHKERVPSYRANRVDEGSGLGGNDNDKVGKSLVVLADHDNDVYPGAVIGRVWLCYVHCSKQIIQDAYAEVEWL